MKIFFKEKEKRNELDIVAEKLYAATKSIGKTQIILYKNFIR